jgi:signal transduction histidine kinase/CheY-like chemotaxis protein
LRQPITCLTFLKKGNKLFVAKTKISVSTEASDKNQRAMSPHFRRSFFHPLRRRWMGLLFCASLGLAGNFLAAENAPTPSRIVSPNLITSFEQIWQMTEVETKEWHRLKLEYVVYYYDPLWKALWGRSGESDSYLSVGSEPFPIKPRQRIRVEGLILPMNGLIVTEPKVTVLAENVPVEILPTRGEIANTQRFNKRLVRVEGYVNRQAARDANHQELELIVEGQSVLVQFLVRNGEGVPQMKGSLIRVQGLYFARNEPNWTSPKLEIWVQGLPDIAVLGELDRDTRFSLPATPINLLAAAKPDQPARVSGKVVAQELGKSLTLRDASGQLTVTTAQTQPMGPDQPVEVIGLPARQGDEWTLQQTLYRRAQRVITRFETIWATPDSEKNLVFPIRLEFVVHYFDPHWKAVWGRCGDVYNYLSLSEQAFPIKPGQLILIEGLNVPAKGLQIDEPKITLLADSVPMEVLSTRGQIGNTERFDKRLTTVEGYVDRQILTDPHHLELDLIAEGRAVTVRLLLKEETPEPNLEGALIQVQGVYSATNDPTSPLPKLEVWVQGLQSLELKGTLAQDKQFDLPLTPIENLGSSSPDKRVRVAGTVRIQEPGKSLTIRDDTGQLIMLSPQVHPFQLGERVEAVGFPLQKGTEWILRDSLYRRTAVSAFSPVVGKPSLRLAEQLRELPPDEAARSYPVQLSGVVTWEHPAADFFFVRDVSGGVCVFQPPQRNSEVIVGSKVQVTGVTASGKFTPVVHASALKVTATLDLPEAKQVTLEQALTGIEEAQWVAMSGYVREIVQEGPWARLHLTTSGGEFDAVMPWSDALGKLRHSVVRLRGVCSALTNAKRQLTGIQLWVRSERYLEIEEAEPADPFSVAARSLTSLRQFSSLQTFNRRVRVTGVVAYQARGQRLLIQEGSEGLVVLSSEKAPLVPGDRIEAVGFLGRENGRTILREANYRRLASDAEPTPVPVASLEKIDIDLDNRLVRIEATLLDLSDKEKRTELIMLAGEVVFEARLDLNPNNVNDFFQPGSRLALTGVYQVQLDEYQRPHDVSLQLRSLHDVVILTRAPWWTAGRALAAMGVLAIGILLGFGWVVALRRRVRQQISQIREQGESEKAAKLEAALVRASKLESLGVLAGGIAHDFNNLLTVVLGNLSLAKLDPKIETETLECLQEGERAAHRARDLTQQLITFAKGGEPVRAVTALPAVVRDATRFALHGSKVRCDYDIAPDLWLAEIDKGQIGQVVHNLVINATHAMPKGGVVTITLNNEEIAAGVHPALPPGRYLRVTITDTGTGIRPELLPRIFDPYFTTKAKGSGLGLASAYSIIKKHHGHIEVQSTWGECTTFSLWLPASAAAGTTAAVTADQPAKIQVVRVLLMDDEASIRQLGGAIFKRLGLDHTAVADGAAVLREYEAARANGCPYDLVMLDLTVPGGMGGAEAMEKLLQLDPKVKAIVSSGYSHDPVMANYRAYGFLGVIPKPYVMAEFVKTIGLLLPAGLAKNNWH